MPKPRYNAPQLPPAEPDESAEPTLPGLNIVDDLDATIGEAEGEPSINLYRMGAPGEKDSFLDTHRTPAEVSEVAVKRKYGGGEYRVKLFIKGIRGIVRNYQFRIAGAPRDPDAEAAQSPSAQAVGSTDALLVLAKMMADGFASLGAVVAANKAPATTRADVLAELKQMREIFFPGGAVEPELPAAPTVADQIEGVRSLLGVVRELAPEPALTIDPDNAGASLLTLADKYLPQILQAMQSMGGRSAQVPPALAAPSVPRAARGTPNVVPLRQNPMMAEIERLTGEAPPVPSPALDKLPAHWRPVVGNVVAGVLKAARDNAPHDALVAELSSFQSMVDAELVEDALTRADWYERLCEIEPAFKDHRAWLTELKIRLESELLESADDAA